MTSHAKVLSVEGTRGVAAFMVILSHLSLTFFPYLHAFSGAPDPAHAVQYAIHHSPFCFFFSGTAAVYVFFVLSGYILSHVALKKAPHEMVGVFLKRYPRLMMPAVASCLLAYAAYALVASDTARLTDWIASQPVSDPTLGGALYSGAIDSFVFGQSSYNAVLWTMQLELIGSFVIFALCLFKNNKAAVAANAAAFALIAVMAYLRLYNAAFALSLTAFLVGNLLQKAGRASLPGAVSLPLLLLGLYFAGAHQNSDAYALISAVLGDQVDPVCNFMAGVLIVCAVILGPGLRDFFSARLFVAMGRLSFSVYLVHLPMVYTLGVFTFNQAAAFMTYDLAALSACVVAIAASYLLATCFHAYVDLPATTLSNRLARYSDDCIARRMGRVSKTDLPAQS